MSKQLEQLNADAQRSLRWSVAEPANWVPDTGSDHDVVIIGGGQSGLAIAYGLRRKGINRLAVLDSAAPGQAGVWITTARMKLLRTQKAILGPEQGNPALGFRAWFETQYGAEAFDALIRIRRTDWADYLAWFQQVARVNVEYHSQVQRIEPLENGLLRLHLTVNGEAQTRTTRKVVLATGFLGGGNANLPGFLHDLPKSLWAHTSEAIDFARLQGKRVGILGAGPSAFDAAAVALEAGAEAVHLFSRRSFINYPSPPAAPVAGARPTGKFYPGASENFYLLPDQARWQHQLLLHKDGPSTPLDSIHRATAFEQFHIHLETPLEGIRHAEQSLQVELPSGDRLQLDYLIAGTGFKVDLHALPELSGIAEQIALWPDRYAPQAGEANPAAEAYPYLGHAFEFTEKHPGSAPYLANIHCYNSAASLSSGKYLGDVPSMIELPRLLSGISRSLFITDLPQHIERINSFAPVKQDTQAYASALWAAKA